MVNGDLASAVGDLMEAYWGRFNEEPDSTPTENESPEQDEDSGVDSNEYDGGEE